jgi:pimeloyl-ACP methyl ester carboxylesterase
VVTTAASYREVRMRDGRTLAYAEYGRPSGRPIVYCHGAPSSRVEGDLIVDTTTATELGARVIVPDRPGVGRSTYQRSRRILDWPSDVEDLAAALGLDKFVVVGSSGGSPYAAACALRLASRVRVLGLIGAIAPLDVAGMSAALSGPLRVMFRLSRFAPPLLRGVFRLNLRAMRNGGAASGERMAAWAPEPDRTLLKQPEIRNAFAACFQEACREGSRGAVTDLGLIARPWGFDLRDVRVPTYLWHGERDRNVPVAHGRYLASAILNCTATFYPDDAHLSVPLTHQRELLDALIG